MATTTLTANDIESVRQQGMDASVAVTAGRVAAAYRETCPETRERALAEDIIGAWVSRAVIEVREALSRQLRHCPFLPHDLAMEMARDVASVAVPMLEDSVVLTDEDLCAIARTKGVEHQAAIARRPCVSHSVVDVLISVGDEPVVATLLGNGGAQVSERTFHRIVDRFATSDAVHQAAAGHALLPLSVAERLIALASTQLRTQLVERFDLPDALATTVTDLAREAATAHTVADDTELAQVRTLVAHLKSVDRLTPTFILRAICDGRIALFEAALAEAASLPLDQARKLLRTDDVLGQSELYQRAGISPLLYPAFNAAVEVFLRGGVPADQIANPDKQIRRVIDRMIVQYEDIDPTDLESVLTRLYKKIEMTAAARAGGAAETSARTTH